MNDNDRLIKRTTPEALEKVCQILPDIAQRHQFGVLGLHNLKEKMISKGVPFDRECRVFEVCNPQQAKEILSRSMDISTVLPCRISVYEENGRTVLASIKPTKLLALFDAPGGAEAALAVEQTLTLIMEETASAR